MTEHQSMPAQGQPAATAPADRAETASSAAGDGAPASHAATTGPGSSPGPHPAPVTHADIVILGGGMAGMTLAVALGTAGLHVVVLEQVDPAELLSDPHDGRASAIAYGPQLIWEATGVWPRLEAAAQPIEDIRVADQGSRLFLHYDHHDLTPSDLPGASRTATPFGHIIENREIRRGLLAHIETLPSVQYWAPISLAPGPEHGIFRQPGKVQVMLEDGRQVAAPLLVSCEGRGSKARQVAGIGTRGWSYGQTGIVCTVVHEHPHEAVAHECFLPSGPFALLPLRGTAEHPHRSSLVWSEQDDLIPALLALDDQRFGQELERRFGTSLGWLRPQGQRWHYPLSLLLADDYISERIALAGDAAHGMHPIAGQGLNLGLRDIAALAEVVVEAWRLGLDIGSPNVLERYRRWRRFDGVLMLALMDGLVRLFSNNMTPLHLARSLGLAAVNQMPGLKRLFMRHAMGVIGELPRLMRGQPL